MEDKKTNLLRYFSVKERIYFSKNWNFCPTQKQRKLWVEQFKLLVKNEGKPKKESVLSLQTGK
jgi:hypothetical protein